MCRSLFTALCLIVAAGVVGCQTQDRQYSGAAAPYTGFQARAIKSLSELDINELRRGGGWGFALPAELNGVPGPAHLLELKDEIGLSADQVQKIEAIYEEMKTDAIAAGENFIAAEEAIDNAFVAGHLGAGDMQYLIDQSAAARAELRFIHLSRHLLTPPLLTDVQVERYKTLRGYTSDPCSNVPKGHDANMWREHNRCR